jgi:polar amino acid transport system substrate-binding protein
MNMQLNKSASRSHCVRIAIAAALVAVPQLALSQAAVEPAPAVQSAASGTLDRVKSAGKLVLGYRSDARPLSYKDASGQAAGYSVTLCQRVADGVKSSLGLPGLAVEWVADAGLPDVQQGNVDLLCGGNAVTLTDRAVVSFSIPIFPGGVSVLLRADASDQLTRALEERPPPYQPLWRGSTPQSLQALQRRTASVVGGTPEVEMLAEAIATLKINSTIAPVDSYAAGVAKVLDGSSDVLFGDRARLLDAARHSAKASDLRVLTRHFTYESLALALRRDDDAFRLVVDRALTGYYALPAFGDTYTAAFGPPDAETVQFFRMTLLPK